MRYILYILLSFVSIGGVQCQDFMYPTAHNASDILITSGTATTLTFNWTNGTLGNRIVLMKSGSAVNSDPVDGTGYTANLAFGSGTQIGTGNYVVFSNSTSGAITVTGLSSNTTYHIAIYEFTGSGATSDYLTTSPATSSYLVNSSSQDFFDRMSVLADPVPDAYKKYYNDLIVALKNTNGIDGTTSYFNSLDLLRINATYSKAAALQNIISTSHNGTIFNDYGGSFTANEGLKGNGTNFRVMTGFNPFDGGTYKYTVNNACYGFFSLTDQQSTLVMDLCAIDASAFGSFLRVGGTGNRTFEGILNTNFIATASVMQPATIGLFSMRKAATTVTTKNHMGVLSYPNSTQTGQLDKSTNLEFSEFCQNTAGAFTNFSLKVHTFIFAGSSNIDANVLYGIIYQKFLKPIGNIRAACGKRALFVGDSMTGDFSGLSANTEHTRTTLLNLGPGWIATQIGQSGRGVSSTAYVTPSINGNATIDTDPYRNTYLDKDIIVMWAGTNDLAGSSGASAATTSGNIDTYLTDRNAAGFKVFEIGVMDRRGTFMGGQNTAGFATVRAAMRTLRLAHYTIATSVPNVWGDSSGNFYLDIYADPIFQDATNTIYWNVDQVHLNTVGFKYLATTYEVQALQLF